MKLTPHQLSIRQNQINVMRALVGVGFLSLGVMKIYNHPLTIGVADNYPQILDDPMLKLFYFHTDPGFQREWWCFGFAMSEIMTGVLLMTGIFTRLFSLIASLMFTKLMLADFGWAEIPHIYPISVLLMVCFSKVYPGANLFGKGDRRSQAKRGASPVEKQGESQSDPTLQPPKAA